MARSYMGSAVRMDGDPPDYTDDALSFDAPAGLHLDGDDGDTQSAALERRMRADAQRWRQPIPQAALGAQVGHRPQIPGARRG